MKKKRFLKILSLFLIAALTVGLLPTFILPTAAATLLTIHKKHFREINIIAKLLLGPKTCLYDESLQNKALSQWL